VEFKVGYDVHITRAEDWLQSKDAPITLAEWKDYTQSDPEMRLDNYAEASTQTGEMIRYESEGLAVWTAYSGHEIDGNMAWFDLCEGRIVVENPDEEIIRKMCAIAQKLDARVQGDELEFYEKSTFDKSSDLANSKPWWKQLFRKKSVEI
jgi:hypothetical protein